MKTIRKHIFVLISLFALTFNTNAQFWYNKYYENKVLTDLDTKELSFLHEKAGQTVNTGVILTIVGLGVSVAGGAIFIYKISHDIGNWNYSGDTFYNILTIGTLTGFVVAVIGIPTIIIGSIRKKGIENIMNNTSKAISLQLLPSIRYDNNLNKYYSGLTVSFNF
jgi:hypothetical protein